MTRKVLLLAAVSMLTACSNAEPAPDEVMPPTVHAATTYYVDAQRGSDEGSGTSADGAWRTLARASQVRLQPGDRLLLRRGATFDGELEIRGVGTPSGRILVGAYGEGRQPVVRGYDRSMYAVRVLNSSYLTLTDLHIVNTGRERLAGRTGLKIEATDHGVSRAVTIDGVEVSDVNGSLVKSEGGGSAILIVNGGRTVASRFDSLTIENCHIARCARNAMIWSGCYDRRQWLPSTNTVVRGCLIEEVPGDGIVPIGCEHTLIEGNLMRLCPDVLPMTEAAAGIWPWSCDDTVIQFNEVSGHKAPWDAQAYDCDFNCRGTVIQYNYSHDNYGGLVLVCDNGAERTYSLGNEAPKVRYNVSIGDGIRPRPTRQGMFSPSIHIAGRVTDALIERNIIVATPKAADDIDRTMVCSDSWDGCADRTTLRRNIFCAQEPSRFTMTESTHNTFDANVYIGTYDAMPADPQGRTDCPAFTDMLQADPHLGQLMQHREACGQPLTTVSREAIERFFSTAGL